MKLSKEATQRIATATARAVKERPAGTSELHAVIASAIGAAVREVLDLVGKELAPLQSRRAMSFQGPHDPSKQYVQGDVTQRSGGVWVCMATTTEAPGSSLFWRKLGKD